MMAVLTNHDKPCYSQEKTSQTHLYRTLHSTFIKNHFHTLTHSYFMRMCHLKIVKVLQQ